MCVFVIRARGKKQDQTPQKKPQSTQQTSRQPSYAAEKCCYEYQTVQTYNGQGPQSQLVPESSISDASTPRHKYASLQHNSTSSPEPNMMGSHMMGHSAAQPMMHVQPNPMGIHQHAHMHPAHAGMMAYPGVHKNMSPQDYDLEIGQPYLTEYTRPPSPPTHVLYKNC